ncbi:L-rhamnose mutarotase, partial [Candidatus Sumerlaeota bacterium]|nr:L-rhamnose mutarotase [Candidatus Sumerlaeota bacterium]
LSSPGKVTPVGGEALRHDSSCIIHTRIIPVYCFQGETFPPCYFKRRIAIMPRYGFLMRLKNESVIPEYEEIHKDVWVEVIEAHRRSGFRNYSIFRHGLDLFACFDSENPEDCFQKVAQEPIMKKWWAITNQLMETKDNKPLFIPIQEIFFME